MQRLSPPQLAAWLNQPPQAIPAPTLLDVREPWEYELARIPGAQLLPIGRVTQEWPTLDSEAPTVVICHHGVRSAQVVHFLSRAGFGQVFNLEGGIAAWAEQVDPAMPRY